MKKRNIFIIIIVTIVIIVSVLILILKEKSLPDTINIKIYNNQDYYIINNDYKGEYDLQYTFLSQYYDSQYSEAKKFEKKEVMSYSEYVSYCNKWSLNQKYSDEDKNYIVFSYTAYNRPIIEARLASVSYNSGNVNLYVWDDASGSSADISAYAIIIPTKKEINNVNVIGLYTNEEFNDIKNNTNSDSNDVTVDKPIIYLYPTKETNVTVKLLNSDKIICSYPKYIDGWNVLAKPNGDLIDLDNKRNLYSLYYESKIVKEFNITQEGFVIKGEDSAKFLEEKLKILGLNDREIEEFIIYWLPRLESNEYNYIRFASNDEINSNMPLDINPSPDSIVRVLMAFKGLENYIEVKEQKLTTPIRNGFVVVEWAGTEIK